MPRTILPYDFSTGSRLALAAMVTDERAGVGWVWAVAVRQAVASAAKSNIAWQAFLE